MSTTCSRPNRNSKSPFFPSPWILGFLVIACPNLAPAQAERPNIVLILADDLGYSDLGCYGGEIHTPRLDRLSHEGLRMTQMYNAARCCSTRAALLTGLYPHQAGVGDMSADQGLPGYRGFLTDRCVTVPTLLGDAGYRTYMSGKWHLRGEGNPECIPTQRGFDEFFGHFRAYASYYRQDLFVRLPEGRPMRDYKDSPFYATDALTDYAIDFMREAQHDSAPFFLYLAYNAPHFPLQAPKQVIDSYVETYEAGWDRIRQTRFDRMREMGVLTPEYELSPRGHVPKEPERNRDSPYYDRQIPAWESLDAARQKDLARRMATYAAMVEIMDRNIGRVVDHLQAAGQLENTLLIFLSDNGACAEWDPLGFDNNPYPKNKLYAGTELELMGQPKTFHSYGTGWANACNTPFRLYKHYNHEGGISSPCIVHWPMGLKRKGEVARNPAHVIDLAATLIDIGGAEYPRNRDGHEIVPLAGSSLAKLIRGENMEARPLFFEHEGNRAMRLGKWKIVWTNFTQQWELYDIDSDRSEMHNLAGQFPQLVSRMSRLWDDWADRSFVEKQRVQQPAAGMPKIYYWNEKE